MVMKQTRPYYWIYAKELLNSQIELVHFFLLLCLLHENLNY